MSYTTFRFSGLRLSRSGNGYTVSLDVTDTGTRAGADVVQVYVGDPASTGEPPEHLKAFQRVSLQTGQTERVTLSLGRSAFQHWDNGWTVTAGTYRVMCGDSSASLPLIGYLRVRPGLRGL